MKSKFFLFLYVIISFVSVKASDYKVLQWNIWQEGTMVPGGYEAIVEEINRLKPDFVTLSEVRNYKNVDFTHRLTEDLKQRGDTFYTCRSYDTGLLSRYPIESFDTIFPHEGDHGTIYRLHTVSTSGDRFAIYTAHLDYQNCTYYEPRGYSGVDWTECEIPSSTEEILEKNDISLRDDAIRNFLEAAEKDIADHRIVIIGGDFNEPSMLDWTENTSTLYDHNGFVVPWTVSKLLLDAGFKDSYRELYPDPIEYPGFTYPSANDKMPISKLTWAPKGDERERIDFIYYKTPSGIDMSLKEAAVFGPSKSISRSLEVDDPGSDSRILPLSTWPTDHKGLLITLSN